MKLGIMQPYFFPYIGYWQLLNTVDNYVVYDDVNYIKNGWINRNNILLNGTYHLITLPLQEASSFKLINEISITQNDILKNKLLKTIKSAYLKAPYFATIMPIIESLILENTNIAKLNYNIILAVKKYLDIDTNILLSSEIEKDNKLKAQDKVLHIANILGATEYYNAIGGQELYNKTDFLNKNIELKFLKTDANIKYKQFKNEFVPHLSIIDVLMFNSQEETKDLLNKYTLI